MSDRLQEKSGLKVLLVFIPELFKPKKGAHIIGFGVASRGGETHDGAQVVHARFDWLLCVRSGVLNA